MVGALKFVVVCLEVCCRMPWSLLSYVYLCIQTNQTGMYLEYACPVWSPYTSEAISKLEKVQKFALCMTSHNWSARYSDVLDDLNVPSLEIRRSQLKLCQLYKIVNGLCYFPPSLINTREQSHILRSTNNFCLQQPFAHTSAHLSSIIPGTISVGTHSLMISFIL